MDEYQLEIQDIRRTLLRLKADKAAEELIEEYEAELRNLVALYQAATDTFGQGGRQPRLPDAAEGERRPRGISIVGDRGHRPDVLPRDLRRVAGGTLTGASGRVVGVVGRGRC